MYTVLSPIRIEMKGDYQYLWGIMPLIEFTIKLEMRSLNILNILSILFYLN